MIDFDKAQRAGKYATIRHLIQQIADAARTDPVFTDKCSAYVSFLTPVAAAALPEHIVKRFPETVTIALQHRFEGLKAHEDRFEVTVAFDGKPCRLVVPYGAVTTVGEQVQKWHHTFDTDEDEGYTDSPAPAPQPPTAPPPQSGAGNTVVSLDAFRKK
ncbi:MAG: ClpXP protease specificity-enhancing factor SspB [Bdellovibrionales bacterium]